MIREAAVFVDKARRGAFGKNTEIPCVTRPMETAVTTSAFADDREIIAAALPRDVMEGTGVTREEPEDTSGFRIADLAMGENEDKSRSWQKRKTHTIRYLCMASWEIKILALGDKLSNMCCTARDYLVVDDAIQQRFSEKDKRKHTRYYWGIAHALKELGDHLYFKEYVMLYRTVFGEDIISSDKDMIQGGCE